MILQTLLVGPLAVNCYIVGDENTRQVFVIDPGGDSRRIMDALRQSRATVTGIVLTHAHFDHVMAVAEVAKQTGAPLAVAEKEATVFETAAGQGKLFGLTIPPLPRPARWLKDQDVLLSGSIELDVIETPGHTPGGICLHEKSEKVVFSGDTLFRGSVGRTDLLGGSTEELLHSIRTRLLPLPPETRVYPGHGPVTTIGEEKLLNPFLQNYV